MIAVLFHPLISEGPIFQSVIWGLFLLLLLFFFVFFRIGKKKVQRKQPKLILIISKPPFWQDNARFWEFGFIQPLTRQKAVTAVIFQQEELLSDSLMCVSEYTSDKKNKKKQLKTHSVNLTHTIVTHTSFHRFNLSTEVTFLDRRSIFSCLNLCCHQQFYSRMSSFVDLKSNHHFRFFFCESLGSLHSLLMWI